jgi:hypothetical protein
MENFYLLDLRFCQLALLAKVTWLPQLVMSNFLFKKELCQFYF